MATLTRKRTSSKVVINRVAANRVRLALADGVLGVGERAIEKTHPPDAPPYGRGLPLNGGAVAYIDGRKVGGNATKPRSERPPKPGIVCYFGFGFPARFNEEGTVHQPARPFFTPPATDVLETEAGSIMVSIVQPQVGGR